MAALNDKVNRLYNDIMMNDSMQAYNDAKTDFDAVVQYVNAIINTAVNGGDPMAVEQPAAGAAAAVLPVRAAIEGKTAKPGKRPAVPQRGGPCPAILNFEQGWCKAWRRSLR